MMDENELTGKMMKVYTTEKLVEATLATTRRVPYWVRGIFAGSVALGQREFILLSWGGEHPKERLLPIDIIKEIEIESEKDEAQVAEK